MARIAHSTADARTNRQNRRDETPRAPSRSLPTTADNENAQALAAAHATPLALVVGRASSGLRTRPSIAHGFDAYAPVMQVLALRVAWLLRRHWRATLAFALAAGLAGGLSMAAWASARRTEHVFSEFLAAADGPELTVTFCPPDVSDVDDADLVECLRYDPEAEVEVLRSLPEVVGADRAAVRTGLVRANDRVRRDRSSSRPCSTRAASPRSGGPCFSRARWRRPMHPTRSW